MAAVKLSMRGFAEISSAAPGRKQALLKRFRSPESGETVGRSNYYVKAISLIKRHHKGESAFVKSSLKKLLADGMTENNPRRRAELLSNHRAVTDYLQHFGARNLTIQTGKHLYYTFENLTVSAQPDFVAVNNDNLILIKLNLTKKDFSGGVVASLLHVLYEDSQMNGLPVKPSGVECIQTSSGTKMVGPKKGFPDKQSLNAACKAILALCES